MSFHSPTLLDCPLLVPHLVRDIPEGSRLAPGRRCRRQQLSVRSGPARVPVPLSCSACLTCLVYAVPVVLSLRMIKTKSSTKDGTQSNHCAGGLPATDNGLYPSAFNANTTWRQTSSKIERRAARSASRAWSRRALRRRRLSSSTRRRSDARSSRCTLTAQPSSRHARSTADGSAIRRPSFRRQPHEPNQGSRATGRAVKAIWHRHPLCTGLGRPAGSCLRWLAQPGGYCGGYNAVGP